MSHETEVLLGLIFSASLILTGFVFASLGVAATLWAEHRRYKVFVGFSVVTLGLVVVLTLNSLIALILHNSTLYAVSIILVFLAVIFLFILFLLIAGVRWPSLEKPAVKEKRQES